MPLSVVKTTDVLGAIRAAGLATPNPRNNPGGCGVGDPNKLQCVELLTTDIFSVHIWATPKDAKHWMDTGRELGGDPRKLLGDRTTIEFHRGGSTPTYDQAAYEKALAGIT